MKPSACFRCSLLALCLVLKLVFCFAGSRGVPATEGIINFGRVDQSLFRGAQPDAAAIRHLKTLGVKSIINLRVPKEASASEEEEAAVRVIGLVYTNVPLAGLGKPTDDEVAKVLSLIDSLPKPVFVHCKHGCDRTGTVIACYRIEHDHWKTKDALNEAGKYGLSRFERGMREYILSFGNAANIKTNQAPIATR